MQANLVLFKFYLFKVEILKLYYYRKLISFLTLNTFALPLTKLLLLVPIRLNF